MELNQQVCDHATCGSRVNLAVRTLSVVANGGPSHTQVKNFEASQRQAMHRSVQLGKSSATSRTHASALQALANGEPDVPYAATLRMVTHEGGRSPFVAPNKTQTPPGFVRNASGGMFTS